MASNGGRVEASIDGRRDRVGERVGRELRNEHARFAVLDRFDRAAAAERDDGTAARLRFERRDAEVLFAGQQRDRRAPVQFADLVVRSMAEKTDVPTGRALERRTLGAVADDRQRHACAPACRNRDVDALVRHERRHDERKSVGSLSIWVKEIGVDRRIDHSGFAIIVSADPARNIVRDSDIAVGAAGGVAIPARQPRHHRPHHGARDPPDSFGTEIGVELTPRVAHGGQAVAEVGNARRMHD